MNNRFVLTLAAVAVLFIGLLVVTKKDTQAPTENSSATIQPTDHVYGEGKKNVTIVEYGDFQCAACGAYFPLVQQLKEKYKEDITFQFRHYPLIEIHPNALIASRAAEAAGMQDKFWEMHDLLYQNQKSWESSSNALKFFEDYATQLGLNVEKFKTDLASDTVNKIVQADRAEAKKQGYASTPTFVINGTKLEQNPRDVEGFEKLITDEIAKQNQSQ